MPFAMVAVTVLLLSSAYGLAITSVDDTGKDTENIKDGITSVSDAIRDTGRFIEAGIGRIINDITTDEDGGTLIDRMNEFDRRLDGWFEGTFPFIERGTTVMLTDKDISLTVANMRSDGTDGTTPSFLRATGTVSIRYVNAAGSNDTVLRISADGTSGLPFVVNSMTRFELSSCGCASALTEMMTYQLSSLAQTRVLNGYGSISEYGDRGTLSIVTEEDVRESLRLSLSVLEELCFRTNGDSDMNIGRVDTAEFLVSDDGYITVDLSAVMSQALIAAGDQIVIKWFDLMWGSEILDLADRSLDGIKTIIRSIQGLFSDESPGSAVPYIESVMGPDAEMYRYVSFPTTTMEIDGSVDLNGLWYDFDDGTIDLGKISIVIDIPEMDVLGWEGWEDFITRYESGRNDIREYIRNAVHTAALECVSGYGELRIKADPYDEESFSQALARAFDTAFDNGIERLNNDLEHIIDTGTVPDPLYQRICSEFDESYDSIFGLQTVRDRMEASVREGISDRLAKIGLSDAGGLVLDALTEKSVSSEEFTDVLESYERIASERKDMFCGPLSEVRKDNGSGVKDAMKYVMAYTLETDFIDSLMRESAECMIHDMLEYHRLNVRSGISELAGEDGFVLKDPDGTSKRIRFRMDDSVDVEIDIVPPQENTGKCSHHVDSRIINLSPYTNVFTVGIKGGISYRTESSDDVLDGLGWYDCAAKEVIDIDTAFDIPFVSGWALCGVDYPPSHTLADEIWDRYGYIIEPLIGPLTEIFTAVKNVYSMCKNAMIEISAYLEELVLELYSLLSEPLELLQKEIEDGMLGMFAGMITAFDLGLGSQSVTMSYMSMSVTLETRLATLKSSTKSLCRLTMTNTIGDVRITSSVEVKENEKNGVFVKCGGAVEGDDWKVKMTVDPLMKFSKRFLKVEGSIRGVDFTASIPEIVQYDELEMKVSDIPGVGEMLSNIPLPIPDVKGSFDMGLFLRYDPPFRAALVINEFESNPAGADRGNEWVELYNGTMTSIDLSGYTIVPGSDESKCITLSGSIPPLGKKVFVFDTQSLNNANGKKKGESLTLYDDEGNEIDSTPWKTDTYNDDRTWQRSTDGSKSWQFSKGTRERSNGSFINVNSYIKTFVIDSLMEAGEEAIYRMGNHLRTVDDIEEFLKLTLELFIDKVIEKIANIIIAAGIFIEIEVQNYSESLHAGSRISLEMNSDLVSDGLRWLLCQIPYLSDFVEAPRCSDPLDIICDDTYLRTTVYWNTSAPRILSKDTELQVMMGVSSAVNISGLCTLFGNERGTWRAEIGLVIIDCPFEIMPKKMKESDGEKGDLWLFRMSFERS